MFPDDWELVEEFEPVVIVGAEHAQAGEGMITPRYAIWESIPVRYSDWEAWAFDGERWIEVNQADVFHKARMLSPELFRNIFGALPPLPAAAFQSEPSYVYGSWQGQPIILDAREAWACNGTQWLELPRAGLEAQVVALTIDAFVDRFPDMPLDLPANAFRS